MTKGFVLAALLLFVTLVAVASYPPGLPLAALAWVAGYFAGRTRAEVGRARHEVNRDIRNATTYRED